MKIAILICTLWIVAGAKTVSWGAASCRKSCKTSVCQCQDMHEASKNTAQIVIQPPAQAVVDTFWLKKYIAYQRNCTQVTPITKDTNWCCSITIWLIYILLIFLLTLVILLIYWRVWFKDFTFFTFNADYKEEYKQVPQAIWKIIQKIQDETPDSSTGTNHREADIILQQLTSKLKIQGDGSQETSVETEVKTTGGNQEKNNEPKDPREHYFKVLDKLFQYDEKILNSKIKMSTHNNNRLFSVVILFILLLLVLGLAGFVVLLGILNLDARVWVAFLFCYMIIVALFGALLWNFTR